MMEPDRHDRKRETEPCALPPSKGTSEALSRGKILAEKIVDEIVPAIGPSWDRNVCLVTKLVDPNYQIVLTGEINRDAESFAFDRVKEEMVRRGLVVTIDFVQHGEKLYLQRCVTGIAANVQS